MKNTLKNLYNIDSKAIIKYSNKVYKVKDKENNEYCLKYLDDKCSNNLIEKIDMINLSNNFVMPIKTCIRAPYGFINNKSFYLSSWIDDDNVDSKDLKLKYYLSMIGKLHAKSSYTINVSLSFFKELAIQIEENIEEIYQYYDKIVSNILLFEYYSPFQWFLLFNYKEIIASLDKARSYCEKLKSITNEKLTIRQVINHLNFSYDHVFILKDKIIGNDKMKVGSPIYDLKSLIDNINFGSIDISGLFELYLSNNKLEEYEVDWLLSLLFVCKKITFTNNEMINIKYLNDLLFRYKSVIEIEKILIKK